MRRLIIFVAMALSATIIVAQNNDNVIKSDFPIIHIEAILADGIEIESIEYVPIYINDDDQRVVHYLDYDNMEWKYIPYPDNENEVSIDEQGADVFLYSGDYSYNFQSETWEEINSDSDHTDSCRLKSYYLSDTWNLDDWKRKNTDTGLPYHIYTFCNAKTDENYTITSIEVVEACDLISATDLDYSAFPNTENNVIYLFYGMTEAGANRICQFDIPNRTYSILADLDQAYDLLSLGYVDSQRMVIEAYIDISDDNRESDRVLTNIYNIDLISEKTEQIRVQSESPITRISRVFDTNDVGETWTYNDFIFGGGFDYIWAESTNESEETFFIYWHGSKPQKVRVTLSVPILTG
jgi:hypothetical protein